MVEEIRRIQRMYVDRGIRFEDIKAQNPNFLLWSRVLRIWRTMTKRFFSILAGGPAAEMVE
jgi:hypothetical protein